MFTAIPFPVDKPVRYVFDNLSDKPHRPLDLVARLRRDGIRVLRQRKVSFRPNIVRVRDADDVDHAALRTVELNVVHVDLSPSAFDISAPAIRVQPPTPVYRSAMASVVIPDVPVVEDELIAIDPIAVPIGRPLAVTIDADVSDVELDESLDWSMPSDNVSGDIYDVDSDDDLSTGSICLSDDIFDDDSDVCDASEIAIVPTLPFEEPLELD